MNSKPRREKKYKVVDESRNIIGTHFLEGMAIIQAKEMEELYGCRYIVKQRGKHK